MSIYKGLRVLARLVRGAVPRDRAPRPVQDARAAAAGEGVDTPAVHIGAQDDDATGEWLMWLRAEPADPFERDAAADLESDFARLRVRQARRAHRFDQRIDALLDAFAPGWRRDRHAEILGTVAAIRGELVTA